MRPEQIKIAIDELFEMTVSDMRPASETISNYTRCRRYIGSSDRRQITEGVWNLWRKKGFPDWLSKFISPDEIDALNTPADVILRANGNRDEIIEKLKKENIHGQKTSLSPLGIRLDKRYNLNISETYKSGLVEVQDEASQMVGLETGISAGEDVFDMCAGAGGKSLLFAQMMQNKGSITAYDISQKSLLELEKRAKRAKTSIIKTTATLPAKKFDVVVTDVPCSGSGTWRRCPDAKWKLTPEHFEKILKTQSEILNKAKDFVKKDGRLCYMTCSLIKKENDHQIETFLKENPDFECIRQKQFSPLTTQTDGLFVAVLKRK